MTTKLRVFVSSVQKELEDERLIVQNLVNTDPFLAAHCASVLHVLEPASPDRALEGCLRSLDTCQVYLLIVSVQHGTPVGEISITHAEYRRAKENQLPVLAFIKGERHTKHEEGTVALLAELDADGPKPFSRTSRSSSSWGLPVRSVPDDPPATDSTYMTNHQLIINQFVVIINRISGLAEAADLGVAEMEVE